MVFCYLYVVSPGLARVIFPEPILDRSRFKRLLPKPTPTKCSEQLCSSGTQNSSELYGRIQPYTIFSISHIKRQIGFPQFRLRPAFMFRQPLKEHPHTPFLKRCLRRIHKARRRLAVPARQYGYELP